MVIIIVLVLVLVLVFVLVLVLLLVVVVVVVVAVAVAVVGRGGAAVVVVVVVAAVVVVAVLMFAVCLSFCLSACFLARSFVRSLRAWNAMRRSDAEQGTFTSRFNPSQKHACIGWPATAYFSLFMKEKCRFDVETHKSVSFTLDKLHQLRRPLCANNFATSLPNLRNCSVPS